MFKDSYCNKLKLFSS